MLNQKLLITYSNQRLRELKANNKNINSIDKILTLDDFILEEYEKKNFKIIINEFIGSSIVYKLIKENSVIYFDYLKAEDDSLNTIYDFIIKCNRNEISFDTLLQGDKLKAIEKINNKYQIFKEENNLVDISDIETYILEQFTNIDFTKYEELYLDDFFIEDFSFIRSKKQEKILKKCSYFKKLETEEIGLNKPVLIKNKNEIFDNIDEVKTAIKISRKLMQEGVSDDEILIITTDTNEYAPLYKLFLDEYEMKGFSSLGTRLNSYYSTNSIEVKNALLKYESDIKRLETIYEKIGLELNDSLKEKIKCQMTIKDEKIGIEITEANQLLGTSKRYKHIIFVGADINHFPPKAKDNFLCSYENELKYFYRDDYFLSSQMQYKQIKKLCDNLYILNASYSGKRELSPSIIVDKKYDKTVDVSDMKSINELALNKTTTTPSSKNTKEFYESLCTEELTKFDGIEVEGIKAKHLSASQINRYITCPLSYLYVNKLKVQPPQQSDEGFDFAEQGTLMHLCFELFGKYIKENKIKSTCSDELYCLMYEKSIEAYNHEDISYEKEENIYNKLFLSSLQAGLKDDRDKGLLAKFVDYYIENAVEFEYFVNSEFEKEFALDSELKPYELKDENDRNYFIKGFIDRFDNLEDSINIIDYKSKKVNRVDKEKLEEIRDLKDIQLALYILFASQKYPNKEYYASLLSFKTSYDYAYFVNMANLDNIKDCEYYDEEYEKDLKELIFEVKKNIEAGIFNFTKNKEEDCKYSDIRFMGR